jgi:hypothetical protein
MLVIEIRIRTIIKITLAIKNKSKDILTKIKRIN